MLTETYKRHLRAIRGDAVAKANIVGMRKALNQQARKDSGLSVNNNPKITEEEVQWLELAIAREQPKIIGELHDSGIKLLSNRRYRNRFTDIQRDIIANIDCFRLIGYEWLDNLHCVPVYRAIAKDGRKFKFRNVPWQSGGNGPEIFP